MQNKKKDETTKIFIFSISFLWALYIGIGFYIVRSVETYFTDKIFIVVLSWAYFIKTISFIFDINGVKYINEKFKVEQNQAHFIDFKSLPNGRTR